MKKILIQISGFAHGRLFDPDARDGCLEPFIHLRDRLRAIGYELQTADDHPVGEAAWVWFWDVPNTSRSRKDLRDWVRTVKRRLQGLEDQRHARNLYQDCIRAGMTGRTALFLIEPAPVRPGNWDPAVRELFPVIFTWHDDYVDRERIFKIREPIPSRYPEVAPVSYTEKKLLVNISGNKWSSHPDELYSARREAIRHFERSHPGQFDLYGTGWNELHPGELPYRCYRGTVRHKWEVYPLYRFGLCYENTKNARGSVSEKIFDCMRAGCVPVYWGAPNISEYVHPKAFVDRAGFRSDAELEKFLLAVTEEEYLEYQSAIESYLQSERFTAFLSPAFADTIIKVLRL